MNLKPETIEKIDKLVPRYPTMKSAALPLCHLVQEDHGYLSNEAIEWIAARLELQPINRVLPFVPLPVRDRHATRSHPCDVLSIKCYKFI